MKFILRHLPFYFALIFVFSTVQFGCRKIEKLYTGADAKLKFSNDTVMFDTVFTSVGTIVKTLKIYNPYNQKLKINEIKLATGSASPFNLNIDGVKTKLATNIEIDAKDSLFIFVNATINPNDNNSPFVISDSLIFNVNGNVQDVDIVAWGQNAYYIRPSLFLGSLKVAIVAATGTDTVWNNTKPIVVYGYAAIDSAASLTIKKGTKIHFHRGGGLWVYRYGKLKVEGEYNNEVVFQGDRLDYLYRDQSNQWDRIWINEHSNVTIQYAKIQNAYIGLQPDILFEGDLNSSQLTIENSIIQNMSIAGILSRFFSINANKVLIQNCGGPCAALTLGGFYSFTNCTFANYWQYPARDKKNASIILNNFNEVQDFPLQQALFENCIVHGSLDDEVLLNKSENTAAVFNFQFKNCLIKGKTLDQSAAANFAQCIKSTSDGTDVFADIDKVDYQLRDNSPAIGKGNFELLKNSGQGDLKQKVWQNPPSLGVYEK
jgi:hypothetical protein